MAFFDTTPTGRILNRCAKDTHVVDEELPQHFSQNLNQLFNIFSVIGVISFVLPWFLAVLPVLVFFYYRLQKRYRATAREVKRNRCQRKKLTMMTVNPIKPAPATVL